jgi:hypothetical protein
MKANNAKRVFRRRNGVPLLPHRRDGKTVTMEMVNRLRDEDEFLDPITGWRSCASGADIRPSPERGRHFGVADERLRERPTE